MSSGSLIQPSDHLEQALLSIHQASNDFSNPDPTIRAQGEATFLALRQSEGALEYSCFALERSQDPLVLFQSLNAILYVLPSLPSRDPSPQIDSIYQLRDFILQFCISKAEQASISETDGNPHSFPQYVRSRSYQTAAALIKRSLGLDLIGFTNLAGGGTSLEEMIRTHFSSLGQNLVKLLNLPSPWPQDPTQASQSLAHISSGLGLTRAIIDEFVMTPIGEGLSTGGYSQDKRESKGKVKAVETGSAVGLSLREHRWCKGAAQSFLLPHIISACLNLLYGVISQSAQAGMIAGSWQAVIFPQAVSALEKLLGWSFLSTNPLSSLKGGASDAEALASFSEDEVEIGECASPDTVEEANRRFFSARKVPNQFSALLMSNDIISLIAASYRHAVAASASIQSRDLSFAIHRLRQCFLLAASFTPLEGGGESDQVQVRRIKFLATNLASMVQEECSSSNSGPMFARGNSLLFLSQLFQTLLVVTPVSQLATGLQVSSSDASGLISFLSSLSQLGRTVFAFAFHRQRDTDEEDDLVVLAEETTDTLLSCWQSLITCLKVESEKASHGLTQDSRLHIMWQAVHGMIRDDVFSPYVNGRLQAASIVDVQDDVSEQGEEVTKDRETYSDQLIMIASLARLSAADNIRFLLGLARPLSEALISVANGQANPTPQQLESTWEQIHWLILISGHVLGDETKGESPEIPSEIVAIQEPEDPVVALIAQLSLNLLQSVSSHGSRSMNATSPQVTETLLWFVGRWTSSYLLVDPNGWSTAPTNAAVQAAFGGEAGKEILSFLLQRLKENVDLWMSDSDVLNQVAAVLSSFSRSSGVMTHLLRLPQMEELIATVIHGLDSLPVNTHGSLISATVTCIHGGPSEIGSEGRSAAHYFEKITAAIESRFSHIVSLFQKPGYVKVSQQSDIIAAVQTSLDMIEGLAQSVQPKSSDAVFSFICKFFPAFANICTVYENRLEVVTLVIRVLHTLAISLELDFGAEPYMVSGLNAAVWDVLTSLRGKTHHALIQSGSGSLSSAALEEDVPYEGLCLSLELLCELMGAAKASSDENAPESIFEPTLLPQRTSDVCIYGFENLVVLINSETLSVPRLRQGFGKLSAGLTSLFADRILGLTVAAAQGHIPTGAVGSSLFDDVVKALALCLAADENVVALDVLEALVPFSHSVIRLAIQGEFPQLDPHHLDRMMNPG
ncbi:hypothetical protein IE53DRAFT_255522 [Violaceomyces palustris]|uniref:Uncharacterized protein n=1 Tax=Violaceomyces palustris TaxID=1673888 RepID=A0ACD0P425_9BASI|nr:hypothetical protein IE53DRAFT_255522 [Violaceomyces palustris]